MPQKLTAVDGKISQFFKALKQTGKAEQLIVCSRLGYQQSATSMHGAFPIHCKELVVSSAPVNLQPLSSQFFCKSRHC